MASHCTLPGVVNFSFTGERWSSPSVIERSGKVRGENARAARVYSADIETAIVVVRISQIHLAEEMARLVANSIALLEGVVRVPGRDRICG